jgi:hypothetical protein
MNPKQDLETKDAENEQENDNVNENGHCNPFVF